MCACVCDPGFGGADCEEVSSGLVCGGRGKCIYGECLCNFGFHGADCGETEVSDAKGCPTVNDEACSGHGTCAIAG